MQFHWHDAPYKEICINLSSLKVYITYYSLREQPTLYLHVWLCLYFLAILKNIHALGDSFYVSIKNFQPLQKRKCWTLNNIFAVDVLTFIYKVLKAIRSWDLVGIKRVTLFENFKMFPYQSFYSAVYPLLPPRPFLASPQSWVFALYFNLSRMNIYTSAYRAAYS